MALIDQIEFTKNIAFNIKMYVRQDWNTNFDNLRNNLRTLPMQKRRFLMFLLRMYTNLPEWLVNIRLTLYSVLIFSLPGLIQLKYVIDHTRYSLIISCLNLYSWLFSKKYNDTVG